MDLIGRGISPKDSSPPHFLCTHRPSLRSAVVPPRHPASGWCDSCAPRYNRLQSPPRALPAGASVAEGGRPMSKCATPLESAVPKNAPATHLECASMRHAPVSISFSTRDLLSFFSFRAHLLGGGRRPPERTRLNSAVRHQLGSRFVLP